jgi:hypothetical protein
MEKSKGRAEQGRPFFIHGHAATGPSLTALLVSLSGLFVI